MLQRFLIVWLTLLSLIAYYWPFDPFVATNTTLLDIGGALPFKITGLTVFIAVTMFFVGCLLTREEIADVFRRWPLVLLGTALQYTAMPLLAYVFGNLFNLDPQFRLGVIMVGCVPGAMASNVLTLAARGNVSYSVSLTTCSTLLSPLVVPLTLWLTLGTNQRLDPWEVSFNLMVTVVGPVVLGHLLCRNFPRFDTALRDVAPLVANLTILWLIAVVVALNRGRIQSVFDSDNRAAAFVMIAALLAINLFGYLAGYLGGTALRIDDPMRRALTLEIGMQNAGLGTYLVLHLFPNEPAAAIPTALYTFGCMFTGALLAQLWAAFGAQSPSPRVADQA
jgi:BASS family bile acid:Na+ symporter